MKFNQMLALVLQIFPDAEVGEEGGEIVIYTGKRLAEEEEVVDLESN